MRFLILASLIAFTVSGCSSSQKVAVPPGLNVGSSSPGEPKVVTPTLPPLTISEASKTSPALLARPVTSAGDNRDPKFSPDGSKLLFLSSARSSHRHSQVYELDLLRSTERRVTFHDGDDDGLSWSNNSWFAYSSTTDEIKEGNHTLERLKNIATSKAPPNDPKVGGELYLQRLDGREINRLTQSPGADITPDVDPTSGGTRIVFVSAREGGSKLFVFDKRGVRKISDGEDAHPNFRTDGKALVWERVESGGKKSRLFISEDLKSATALTSAGFRDQQASWHPKNDSVIFSSNRGGSTFDLFVYDRKAQCVKRLTSGENDALYPTFSPDGSKIAFVVANTSGQSQIYLMEDRSASTPCL
jgi:Tol biopolymer transport system component